MLGKKRKDFPLVQQKGKSYNKIHGYLLRNLIVAERMLLSKYLEANPPSGPMAQNVRI